MSQLRPSLCRDAFKVSPQKIALLNESDLNDLMDQLIKAQAYICKSPISEISINAEEKAKDDGCDGWTSQPGNPDEWLGRTNTCWQFKAGRAGEPTRLKGEVTKKIPKETLENGGRFVVVTSGSRSGKRGRDDRLKVIRQEAESLSLPTDNILVFDSELLSNWCNQHPAIAARWEGRPNGLWTLEDWSISDEHQVPWQATTIIQSDIEKFRNNLDFINGDLIHLHIHGQPGVGKTRFALELCRNAEWNSFVIYIRQSTDFRLIELIDSAVPDLGTKFMIVADEVQPDMLRPLRDSVGRGNGRIRLISIGHCPSPDPSRIPAIVVEPLNNELMASVVTGWYPCFPREYTGFVVRFSDGYVRLARLAANAVAQKPDMNVHELLNRQEIRGFLDRMLGTGDRKSLYVVAALNKVGWTGDLSVEGETIAQILGLDWSCVRVSVERFNSIFGIAPQGGRYRYISPTPLGTHLAVEAWMIFTEEMRSLPDKLPTEESRDSYYNRLKSIASNVQVREYAKDQLKFFFEPNRFVDAKEVLRWSALTAADPDLAARKIALALENSSIEDRLKIAGKARREIVWTLTRLAWRMSSFQDATTTLALLAEAENETWSNNASGEFIARFQIYLGGTALPYTDRLTVINKIIDMDSRSLDKLAIKALSKAGEQHASRSVIDPVSDETPELEWQPKTQDDYKKCILAAINILSYLAERGFNENKECLVGAANNIAWMIRKSLVQEEVKNYFKLLRCIYPEQRETLRRLIYNLIYFEKNHWKELIPEELKDLESFHSEFEGTSLRARLLQLVGHPGYKREDTIDLKPVAEDLISSIKVLEEHWQWLTSGQAVYGFGLGEAIAEIDKSGELEDVLPSFKGSGPDLSVMCGYICKRRTIVGDAWYEKWVSTAMDRYPNRIELIIQVARLCGATDSIAKIIADILRREIGKPATVGQLVYSNFAQCLSAKSLENVIRAMVEAGHSASALAILDNRLKNNPDEFENWKPLALELVILPELVGNGHMISFYWKEVAASLVAYYPGEIASAILRKQTKRGKDRWFIKHSNASEILDACIEVDPSSVWRVFRPYLSDKSTAYFLSIGFPRGVLERMPRDEVKAWIAENPKDNAPLVAQFISMDVSSDDTIAAQVIGEFGDYDDVASAFFANLISGSFSGPISVKWHELSKLLVEIAKKTSLPKLRQWVLNSVQSLKEMAERDELREEEDDLRFR